MRFQTKIIAGYALLMFALALIIGLGYHGYTKRQMEKTEEMNIQVTADQLRAQVEERISRMELVTEYILSEPNILEGMQILAMDDAKQQKQYKDEASSAIHAGINTYYITKNFYRTVWFNQKGDTYSTYNSVAGKTKTEVDFEKMPYLKEAKLNTGKPILISAHEDPWGVQQNPQVFSLLKVIQGKNMGYIEVQYRVSDFAELQVPTETISFLITVNENELFYASEEDMEITEYLSFMEDEYNAARKIGSVNGEDVLAAKSISDKYPISVLVLEDTKEIMKTSAYITPMTFVIALTFFIISMFFVIMLSRILTKPLSQLRTVMENTKLENLGQDIALTTSNDEIQALSVSYQDVMERLQESMVKEQRLAMLQLQAQFDSLQAQVNPHFLYNVLNIISARGMTDGDEKICEMCESLASMLRYSTNNKNRYATIKEELEYLQQYFYLLKARYEHKIEFQVAVDSEIGNQLIPKVALQQIVENCINHGFENSTEQMKVEITGYIEDGYWYIKIHDNGQGFEKEVLQKLEHKMQKSRRRLLKERANMELEIGGMGLINTYARCLLLYNDDLIFEMKNEENGADVILGAKLKIKE